MAQGHNCDLHVQRRINNPHGARCTYEPDVYANCAYTYHAWPSYRACLVHAI
jgi:hypothetical protein